VGCFSSPWAFFLLFLFGFFGGCFCMGYFVDCFRVSFRVLGFYVVFIAFPRVSFGFFFVYFLCT
jgi:hypothetical protein